MRGRRRRTTSRRRGKNEEEAGEEGMRMMMKERGEDMDEEEVEKEEGRSKEEQDPPQVPSIPKNFPPSRIDPRYSIEEVEEVAFALGPGWLWPGCPERPPVGGVGYSGVQGIGGGIGVFGSSDIRGLGYLDSGYPGIREFL